MLEALIILGIVALSLFILLSLVLIYSVLRLLPTFQKLDAVLIETTGKLKSLTSFFNSVEEQTQKMQAAYLNRRTEQLNEQTDLKEDLVSLIISGLALGTKLIKRRK